MTDNEIIKALECCSNDKGIASCVDCPLANYSFYECGRMLPKYALDLINRQKAENEKKDIEIDILIRKKETLRDEISDQKAEIERLQIIIDELIRQYNKDISKPKSEAIKEFAERLKSADYYTETGVYCLDDDDIDNLLKELTHQPTKIEHNSLCETETYESRCKQCINVLLNL